MWTTLLKRVASDSFFFIIFTRDTITIKFSFSSYLTVCGVRGREQKIVGGSETLPNELPWVAGLFRQNKLYCGASIVTNKFLITAAHCVSSFEPNEIRVSKFHQKLEKMFILFLFRYSLAVIIFHETIPKSRELSASLLTKILIFSILTMTLPYWNWKRQFSMDHVSLRFAYPMVKIKISLITWH